MHCFYIEPPRDGVAALPREEARHAARVLRLKRGDAVCAMDGERGRWEAVVESVSGEMVTVRLGAPLLRITPVRYIRLTCVLGGAALAAGVLSGNAAVMCGATVLSALLAGAVIPMILHVSCERFSENTMLATTAVLLCVYAGQALGPAVIGQMEGALSIGAGILACAVMLALSGVVMLGMRE